MRYGIALAVAVLFIGAGALFAWQTDREVDRLFRQGLRDAEAAGTLPKGIDPETAAMVDFGVELPLSVTRRVRIAHALIAWRAALIPFLLVVCLGTAGLSGAKRP